MLVHSIALIFFGPKECDTPDTTPIQRGVGVVWVSWVELSEWFGWTHFSAFHANYAVEGACRVVEKGDWYRLRRRRDPGLFGLWVDMVYMGLEKERETEEEDVVIQSLCFGTLAKPMVSPFPSLDPLYIQQSRGSCTFSPFGTRQTSSSVTSCVDARAGARSKKRENRRPLVSTDES